GFGFPASRSTSLLFFFQAEDGIRYFHVTGVQTCALPILAAQGYVPTRVGHGLAALAELQRREFDLALLDLDLPGIDGLALARQLRAQGWKRPIVALTARADSVAEPLARQAGFDAFLRKPISGEDLAATLAGLLAPSTESSAAVG